MNNKQIVSTLARNAGCTNATAQNVLNSFVNLITTNMTNGNDIKIYRLGIFKAITRKARNGVNPSTGEKIKIAETKSMSFKASSAIKNTIKGL